MSLKYDKTQSDKNREGSDLRYNVIMKFLKQQENFKFNIGDILIKQTRYGDDTWKTETTSLEAPKKYMYVFENELGIGYIKQLRVDGSGFTTLLQCTANFDYDYVRLTLDPDFVDHMIIGEEEFQYNQEYVNKKNFRKDAIAKNRKLLIGTQSFKKRLAWFHGLKIGDKFWYGDNFDELV